MKNLDADAESFTEEEQRILATHVESVRKLAIWNHIQSVRSDSPEDNTYYVARSDRFYDVARNLESRKKKA